MWMLWMTSLTEWLSKKGRKHQELWQTINTHVLGYDTQGERDSSMVTSINQSQLNRAGFLVLKTKMKVERLKQVVNDGGLLKHLQGGNADVGDVYVANHLIT